MTLDETIPGSYEEGPDNILSFARRDRRWCQGNLQHIRLLTTPGLHPWSRFTFLQGIFSYLVSLVWGLFLVTSIAGRDLGAPAGLLPRSAPVVPGLPQ